MSYIFLKNPLSPQICYKKLKVLNALKALKLPVDLTAYGLDYKLEVFEIIYYLYAFCLNKDENTGQHVIMFFHVYFNKCDCSLDIKKRVILSTEVFTAFVVWCA